MAYQSTGNESSNALKLAADSSKLTFVSVLCLRWSFKCTLTKGKDERMRSSTGGAAHTLCTLQLAHVQA